MLLLLGASTVDWPVGVSADVAVGEAVDVAVRYCLFDVGVTAAAAAAAVAAAIVDDTVVHVAGSDFGDADDGSICEEDGFDLQCGCAAIIVIVAVGSGVGVAGGGGAAGGVGCGAAAAAAAAAAVAAVAAVPALPVAAIALLYHGVIRSKSSKQIYLRTIKQTVTMTHYRQQHWCQLRQKHQRQHR